MSEPQVIVHPQFLSSRAVWSLFRDIDKSKLREMTFRINEYVFGRYTGKSLDTGHVLIDFNLHADTALYLEYVLEGELDKENATHLFALLPLNGIYKLEWH